MLKELSQLLYVSSRFGRTHPVIPSVTESNLIITVVVVLIAGEGGMAVVKHAVVGVVLLAALCCLPSAFAGSFNYAEALQKSWYFYECQVRLELQGLLVFMKTLRERDEREWAASGLYFGGS